MFMNGREVLQEIIIIFPCYLTEAKKEGDKAGKAHGHSDCSAGSRLGVHHIGKIHEPEAAATTAQKIVPYIHPCCKILRLILESGNTENKNRNKQ